MRLYHSFQVYLTAILASWVFYPSFAKATVITVETSGEYQVNEAKNFKQRGIENSDVSAKITNTSLDLAATSEPFIARIIPSPNNLNLSSKKNTASISNKTPKTAANPYMAIIQDAALNNSKLDTALINAVIAVESNFNASAVSPKGAMGLMQLMPATAERLGVTNPFDPTQNIQAGARELNTLIETNANISLALAAYNAGQGAVTKYDGIPPYKETQNYVVKVLTKTYHDRQKLFGANKLPKKSKPIQDIADKNEKRRPMKVYTYDW